MRSISLWQGLQSETLIRMRTRSWRKCRRGYTWCQVRCSVVPHFLHGGRRESACFLASSIRLRWCSKGVQKHIFASAHCMRSHREMSHIPVSGHCVATKIARRCCERCLVPCVLCTIVVRASVRVRRRACRDAGSVERARPRSIPPVCRTAQKKQPPLFHTHYAFSVA